MSLSSAVIFRTLDVVDVQGAIGRTVSYDGRCLGKRYKMAQDSIGYWFEKGSRKNGYCILGVFLDVVRYLRGSTNQKCRSGAS